MNWLQKLAQSKPMALPIFKPESLIGQGYQKIDMQMSPDTADKEKSKYPNIEYKGSGENGLAVDIGNNKILKYTSYEFEFQTALDLMHKKLPCIIPIYKTEQVQDKPYPLWSILMEKAQPLDPQVAKQIDNRSYTIYGPKIYKQVEAFLNCLEQNNIPSRDATSENVGTIKGQLVLFDLGDPERR